METFYKHQLLVHNVISNLSPPFNTMPLEWRKPEISSFCVLPNQSPSFQISVYILPFYSESSMAPTAFRLFHLADKPFPEHPMPNPLDPCSCPISTPTSDLLRRETACWFCVSSAWHSAGLHKLFEGLNE